MKKKLIAIITALLLSVGLLSYSVPNANAYNFNAPRWESYQATIHYAYSDDDGHYFINPLSRENNLMFVATSEGILEGRLIFSMDELYAGKKYHGVFINDENYTDLLRIYEIKSTRPPFESNSTQLPKEFEKTLRIILSGVLTSEEIDVLVNEWVYTWDINFEH